MRTVDVLKRHLFVAEGKERFELRPGSEPVVRGLLDELAARPDAITQAKDVLRLMVALETRLDSPSAADRLRGWLRQTPALHGIIRRLGFASTVGVDAIRDFRRREGREGRLQAPVHDARRPRGSVPLRDLFVTTDPLRAPRRR